MNDGGNMGKEYDPWAHAQELGITVIEATLPPTRRGEYRHREHLIALARGLSQREARATLTHELQHALAGDAFDEDCPALAVAERLASQRTAYVLIDPLEYAEAEELHGGHLASIAYELNVTPKVVRDFQSLLRRLVA